MAEAIQSDGIDLGPIPVELFQKCSQVVRTSHRHKGISDLPLRITSAGKDHMTALVLIPASAQLMSSIDAGFKLWLLTWVAGVGLVVGSLLLTWWMLLALPLVGFAAWRLKSIDKDYWIFEASVLLALDMLASDFAGWGAAFPAARRQALEILGGSTSSEWLDYYLPHRATLDVEKTHRALGPKAASGASPTCS